MGARRQASGADQPVPSVQLKWLRRAQQDYEYLWLAQQRGERTNAAWLARFITKSVELQPGQLVNQHLVALVHAADRRMVGPHARHHGRGVHGSGPRIELLAQLPDLSRRVDLMPVSPDGEDPGQAQRLAACERAVCLLQNVRM